MKHLLPLLMFSLMLLGTFNAHAVYVENMPVNKIQPSGDTLHFFVTGDECYHRYHDADGFTIVQDHAGYWVYAIPDNNGSIQPSSYHVGTISPTTLGIKPGLTISREEWLQRRHAWDIPEEYRIQQPKTSGRNHGDYCNLVVFIRFADDTAYTRPLSSINQMFTDSTSESSSSVYNYFKHASYNKLFVRTYYAPEPDSNRILSYQSPHPRAYYMPRTEANPIGYTNDRTEREFDLLVGAVNYINDSCPVPTSYNLDCDNDGYIDNVNFVVKGSYTGWSDLLWPHKWNLYGYNVYINGKQVNTFNFALEGAGGDYFGSSTFCHEMFHSLGAPDLYHYNESTNITPVGSWDLMATNSKPPQHMSAYMKYKYGNWLDSIPLITEPGTYTLHSVGDSTYDNIAYRFPSSDPDQFFVVEYRDNTETFETALPGRGLLIYRIDTRFDGNASYDGHNYLDEVWLFRPESNSSEENGLLAEAYFSKKKQRTEFSPSTYNYPYLSDGSREYTFSITNVTIPGNTISFRYSNRCKAIELHASRITTVTATLNWDGIADAYRIYYRHADSDEPYQQHLVRTTHTTITGLNPNDRYEWTVRALYDPIDELTFSDSTALAATQTFHTELCNNAETITIGHSEEDKHTTAPFAFNKKYNYTQEIYLASELNGSKNISTLHLHYAHTTALDRTSCTIYLANTTQSLFNDSLGLIPGSELTQVYSGPLHFERGWNEIVLDTPFTYDGTSNLVVAFLDRSETPTRSGERFYTNTPNSHHMTINYTSDNDDLSIYMDTTSDYGTRVDYRNNIRFVGCPIDYSHVYLCLITDNEEYGRVSGEGSYTPNTSVNIMAIPNTNYAFTSWNDGNTDNPRNIELTQDTIFIAYFQPTLAVDSPEEHAGYLILTQHLRVTIQGAENQPVAIYDLMGRPIFVTNAQHSNNISFDLPHSGIYIIRIGNNVPTKIFVQ